MRLTTEIPALLRQEFYQKARVDISPVLRSIYTIRLRLSIVTGAVQLID